VTIDDPSNELRPGLSTTAKITTAQKPSILALPIQALTMHSSDDDKTSKDSVHASASPVAKSVPVQGVFVVDGKSKLRVRFVPVTTGITGATDIEALSGLKEGDEIVIGPTRHCAA